MPFPAQLPRQSRSFYRKTSELQLELQPEKPKNNKNDA